MYHPLEADERCNAQGRMNSRPDVREPPAMLLLMGTLALFWVGCKQPDLCGGGLQYVFMPRMHE